MDRQNLDYEILRCVDNGLNSMGPSIRQMVYWQLLMKFNLRMSQIPENAEVFAMRLESILGSGGAIMAERAIVSELISAFGLMNLPQKRLVPAMEFIMRREASGITV
jgi:hypothetical protein